VFLRLTGHHTDDPADASSGARDADTAGSGRRRRGRAGRGPSGDGRGGDGRVDGTVGARPGEARGDR
jgi:hypothetical protein